MPSQALLQRGKKPYRLVMLFKEISESLCRKLRERAAGLFRNSFYRVPSIVIKSDSLTVHDNARRYAQRQKIYTQTIRPRTALSITSAPTHCISLPSFFRPICLHGYSPKDNVVLSDAGVPHGPRRI